MIDNLLKFKKVYDLQSFTKAAKSMHLTQSAVSQSILELEKQAGQELIYRKDGEIKLTLTGQEFYEIAKSIQINRKNLSNLINESKHNNELRIGSIDSFGLKLIKNEIKRFKRKHDGVKVTLKIDNTQRLINSLANFELDFAFITKPIKSNLPKGFSYRKVTDEEFLLVSHKSKNLNSVNKDFIAFNEDSNTFKLINNQIQGLDFNYSYFSTSPEIMLELVKQTKSFSAVPSIYLKKNSNFKVYRKIRIEREIGLIWIEKIRWSRVIREFLELGKE